MSGEWGYDELAILHDKYAEHGPTWVGWESLLPGRTAGAIACMASKVGLKCRGNGPLERQPDPDEPIVLMKMEQGLTPAEIDEKMHWRRGRAKDVLTERWRRSSTGKRNRNGGKTWEQGRDR